MTLYPSWRPSRQDAAKREAAEPCPIAPHLSLDDPWVRCIEHWLADKCTSPKSALGYGGTLRAFFASCGNKHPSEVTKQDAEHFLTALTSDGKPPAPATRNHRLKVVSSFYRFASGYTIAGTDAPLYGRMNPASGIKYRKTVSKAKGMTQAELKKFFQAIDQAIEKTPVQAARDRALFTTYLHTAARLSAITGLRWGDLEPTIFGTGNTRRKGWKYRTIRKGSGGEYIYAELPETCRREIWRYLEVSGRLPHMRADSPLFTAIGPSWAPVEGEQALKSTAVNHLVKKYLTAAQLPLSHSTNSFRHTSAQMRYRSGQDLLSISKTLGHSSIATTQVYLQALCVVDDDGAAALADELGEL